VRHLRRWAALAALGVVVVSAVSPTAGAQGYFGQNQVQYDRLDWRVLETEHFLVHYYPEERLAVQDAARMAERSYARLSRVLNHQFREKKPLILFASRTDFGQNNVTGDLGEGTGGVTDAARQRNMLPFTGDYRSFEHVLTHEMVHQFQYDIFGRGKAGANIQQLAQVNPPLWLFEGMAEYLALGPGYPITNAKMRDAALNGAIPTLKEMTDRPDRYNPYEFGEALFAYIGQRWGDEVVGQIMDALPSVGVERAFKRELGLSLEDLGDEWREALQTQWLPQVAQLERARRIAQPLLTEKRSGGQVFVAPTLSSDGRYIAFLSNGRFLRGEISIDLYLANARTGKRIGRLTNTLTNTNTEELRLLYSQSNFSPDSRRLAFVSQRRGKDVLNILDVRRREIVRTIDRGFEQLTGPAWSPDGRRIVFSAGKGGLTDLFVVDADGRNMRQLTRDAYGDLQPTWSPDGRTIAFASDRGPGTDLGVLQFAKWQLSTLDVATNRVTTLPKQSGLNLNPQWAPDGRSLAYVSDRAGTANVFLYDLDAREHYQLTNLVGVVGGFTEYSPAITWARGADRLAFSYLEKDEYTVWSIDNPRLLRRAPYRGPTTPPATLAQTITTQMTGAAPMTAPRQPAFVAGSAAAFRTSNGTGPDTVPAARRDTTAVARGEPPAPRDSGATTTRSFYRGAGGVRASAELPASARGDTTVVSVAALLDSATIALPDTTRFKDYDYKGGLQPDYVARPSVGVAQDNFFGRGVFGGTTVVLSDLLGNSHLALSGQVNGRLSDAQVYAGYTQLGGRLQYNLSGFQTPFYFATNGQIVPDTLGPLGSAIEQQGIARLLIRQVGATGLYPLNRFTRFEFGALFNNVDRSVLQVLRGGQVVGNTFVPTTGFQTNGRFESVASFNYAQPFVAFVSDNTLSGLTASPLIGRRMRFDIAPSVGTFRIIEYTADYRRYDPILFNFLTVATRVQTSIGVGRDELTFQKYIGNPQFIRGYDRANFGSIGCSNSIFGGSNFGCNRTELLGSRVALANAELRFPLIRRVDLGLLPISLPPLEGLVFYDAGVAWSRDQNVNFRRAPDGYDAAAERYLLTSYGAGLRLNLFGFAIVRWDYAIPIDSPTKKGFWTWSVGPSF
jgi:dipeptidyl aminopeptidase/acylaminoacyl peptidase